MPVFRPGEFLFSISLLSFPYFPNTRPHCPLVVFDAYEMALISSSLPTPSFASSPSSSSSSTSSSKKSYYDIKPKDTRSLSTSLLPRPSISASSSRSKLPSTLMYTHHQPYRRRPSHIPQLKPSTSNNSNSLSTITTTTSSSQTSRSTSSSVLTLPHPAAMPGTRSSPLKMVGHQQTNARVLVQCLGSQLLVEDSGAVVTLHQQQRGVKAKRKRFVFGKHAYMDGWTVVSYLLSCPIE
jgi:hypothetical protein